MCSNILYAQFSPSKKIARECKSHNFCSGYLGLGLYLGVVHGVSHGVSRVVGHRVSLGAGLGCPHVFGHGVIQLQSLL